MKPRGGAVIELAGNAWRISAHALDRLIEMNIDGDRVRECLRHPERVTPSIKYPGSKHYRLGDFTLCISFTGDIPTVVTAVWATRAAWEADLVGRPAGDRELRDGWPEE